MADNSWGWYMPCTTCFWGTPYILADYISGKTRPGVGNGDRPLNLCPHCGGMFFLPPRPGMFIPRIWWKPWTWISPRWIYRHDHAIDWYQPKPKDDDNDYEDQPEPAAPRAEVEVVPSPKLDEPNRESVT